MAAEQNQEGISPGHDGTSPESWARRLRRGESGAVEEVRRRVANILAHRGLGISPPEREDLEQEVMTEVWKAVNRSHFNFSGGFWGFIEVVASRRCIDWLRSSKESCELPREALSQERGPLRIALDREERALAFEILSALPSQCQEIIMLRLGEELRYEEIARRTGKSSGALRIQYFRCIRQAHKLKARLLGSLEHNTNRSDAS